MVSTLRHRPLLKKILFNSKTYLSYLCDATFTFHKSKKKTKYNEKTDTIVMTESRAQMHESKGYTLQDVIVSEKAFPQTREVHKASKTPPSKSLASKELLLPSSLILTTENGWPGAPNPTAQPSQPINFEWSLNHLKWKLCPGKNDFKLSLRSLFMVLHLFKYNRETIIFILRIWRAL